MHHKAVRYDLGHELGREDVEKEPLGQIEHPRLPGTRRVERRLPCHGGAVGKDDGEDERVEPARLHEQDGCAPWLVRWPQPAQRGAVIAPAALPLHLRRRRILKQGLQARQLLLQLGRRRGLAFGSPCRLTSCTAGGPFRLAFCAELYVVRSICPGRPIFVEPTLSASFYSGDGRLTHHPRQGGQCKEVGVG